MSHQQCNVIRRLSSFTDGWRPQVPFRALFQAQAGTWVEPPTFRKLAGYMCSFLVNTCRDSNPQRWGGEWQTPQFSWQFVCKGTQTFDTLCGHLINFYIIKYFLTKLQLHSFHRHYIHYIFLNLITFTVSSNKKLY